MEAEEVARKPAGEVLDLISELYAAERDCSSDDDRKWIRGQRSRDVVKRIQEWALRQEALPGGSPGKVIAYMGDLWPGLLRFLDDPRLALDNNATKPALRRGVVGCKNHSGSRSERGTEVGALFYTLIECAKLARVEPNALPPRGSSPCHPRRAAPAAARTLGVLSASLS